MQIYRNLYRHFGPQHWWPVSAKKGDKVFEICVGAILTQNTNWKNVELALAGLRKARLLTPCAIAKSPARKIERLIRPSGYFRQKAKKLKIFAKYICDNYQSSAKKFLQGSLEKKRPELLSIWGIGPETVDSMLLYAGKKTTFVIDAYTRRLCKELGIEFKDYEEYRAYFQKRLRPNVELYNEFHALIVAWGKLLRQNRGQAVVLLKIKKCPRRVPRAGKRNKGASVRERL